MRNINCEIYNITIPGSNWRVAKFEKKYANLKKNLIYLHSYRLKKHLNESLWSQNLIKALNYRIYKTESTFKKYSFEAKKDAV